MSEVKDGLRAALMVGKQNAVSDCHSVGVRQPVMELRSLGPRQPQGPGTSVGPRQPTPSCSPASEEMSMVLDKETFVSMC